MRTYLADPLYKAVLEASGTEEQAKAVTTVKAIRGETAWRIFIKALAKSQNR